MLLFISLRKLNVYLKMRNNLFWRNNMSILNYVLADKEKKQYLREGYANVLKRSNTYRLGAGIGNLASGAATGIGNLASGAATGIGNLASGAHTKIGSLVSDAATGVNDFASNITFNPLPYGDMANSAYEGIQNIYGNWLDDKYDAVADWYKPVTTRWNNDPFNFSPHPGEARDPYYAQEDWKPDMIAEGPLSRAPANFRSAANQGLTPAVKYPDSNDWYWNMGQEPIPYHERVKYYDEIPSNEIPGYDRMVNEGYDSWSPSDAIHNTWTDSNTDGYQPYSEMTQDEKDLLQKEHMQRIDTGLGTLYPGEAADRYYDNKHNAFRDRQREGMASGAYKAWSNQLGRGLLAGDMIGESMNRAGRIHPVLKADWDAEMAGTRNEDQDYQPWKTDNRSDWQKWKDSVSGGRR
jgi:hypothetical protein